MKAFKKESSPFEGREDVKMVIVYKEMKSADFIKGFNEKDEVEVKKWKRQSFLVRN